MSENTENNASTQSPEATQEKVVPSLARGNAPALGASDVNGSKDSSPKNEGAKPKDSEPAPKNDAASDGADDELADTTADIPDDRYIETPIEEVNELVSELKRLKIPFAKANMLLEEAFNAADSSKLNRENFEAVLGKENAKPIYMYAKVAIAAIKNEREANSREMDKLSGGSWKQLAAKAKQMLPKADLKEYQELINMGGTARKIAIREIIAKTSNNTTNKQLLTGDNSSSGDDYVLSASQYRKEADKIYAKYTRAGMLTAEGRELMATLDKRRTAGIKAGR